MAKGKLQVTIYDTKLANETKRIPISSVALGLETTSTTGEHIYAMA